MRYFFLTLLALGLSSSGIAQTSLKDSLQGGLRPARTDFDLQHIELDLKFNISEKKIAGKAIWKVGRIGPSAEIQIDLHRNFKVDSIVALDQGRIALPFHRAEDAIFANVKAVKTANLLLEIYYQGQPHEAIMPPWDGGVVYKKDRQGKPWIGVAVQGMGGSMWYPSKDHQYDEPQQGARIKMAVPNSLQMISNGKFKGSFPVDNTYTRWDWEVTYPINNYNITFNIGDYELIEDSYKTLPLSYYVLRGHRELAIAHFAEVKTMLACFEEKFGSYPFPNDGYKLVETPYLGMEHQSAIAYGNRFEKGYLGADVSGTGVGLHFDFITIHESAHEWFGNSITSRDIADMWIHEAFTTYAESVYIECTQGKEAAYRYINGQRKRILNDRPILGEFGLNDKGSADMYNKGAYIIHSIRTILQNDELFWKTLRGFYQTFKMQNINGRQVIDYWNSATGLDLTDFFEHHLTQTASPELVIEQQKGRYVAYFTQVKKGFAMPIPLTYKGETILFTVKDRKIQLPKTWKIGKEIQVPDDQILIDLRANSL